MVRIVVGGAFGGLPVPDTYYIAHLIFRKRKKRKRKKKRAIVMSSVSIIDCVSCPFVTLVSLRLERWWRRTYRASSVAQSVLTVSFWNIAPTGIADSDT